MGMPHLNIREFCLVLTSDILILKLITELQQTVTVTGTM
jgi:hypothetical protein